MNSDDPRAAAAARYAGWWSELGRHGGEGVERVFASDARFCDPFVELVGRDAIRAHMAATARRLDELTVVVTDTAFGRSVYLKWRFAWRIKDRNWAVEGVSEIDFDEAGLVRSHVDHWDAAGQIYARIRGLGWLIRLVSRKAGG